MKIICIGRNYLAHVKELDNDKLEGENLKIIIPEETET